MTSRRIMVLALLATAVSGYLIFFKDRDDFVFLFSISLVVLTVSYVFQYQIDQLMIRGVAQRIPVAMRAMLMNTAPHFQQLTVQQKLMMEDRMARWIMKKEFISQNKQDAPEDVKFILAYYAILLTLHQKEYLYDNLDRIVFYHHPFLTPAHEDDVHIYEIELKDGTIIISVPHLLKGHLEKGYYNIALHSMADAFRKLYLKNEIQWPDDIWEILEDISAISKQKIEDYIGLPIDEPWPVAVHHQFTYSQSNIPEVVNVLPQSGVGH
jgi:hypothetical protein